MRADGRNLSELCRTTCPQVLTATPSESDLVSVPVPEAQAAVSALDFTDLSGEDQRTVAVFDTGNSSQIGAFVISSSTTQGRAGVLVFDSSNTPPEPPGSGYLILPEPTHGLPLALALLAALPRWRRQSKAE